MENYETPECTLNEKGEKLQEHEVSPAMKELIADRKKEVEADPDRYKFFHRAP